MRHELGVKKMVSQSIGRTCKLVVHFLLVMLFFSLNHVAAQTRSAIIFPEAIGPWLATIFIARDQGFFAKRGLELNFVEVKGASVPKINNEVPFGFVGGPAALIQATSGTSLRNL